MHILDVIVHRSVQQFLKISELKFYCRFMRDLGMTMLLSFNIGTSDIVTQCFDTPHLCGVHIHALIIHCPCVSHDRWYTTQSTSIQLQ